MRLGFKESWAGRRRRTAVCPDCSSDRARYSRRHYDGLWFLLFRVRPVKCSDCGAYFPIAGNATIRRPETDPIDLHIPFRPSELDDPGEDPEAANDDLPARSGPRPARGACPMCASRSIHPSRPGGDQPLLGRLEVTTTYRCAQCNGSFKRANPLKLFAFLTLLLLVLGGLSYLATAVLGRSRPNPSPLIRKDEVRPPPPPVFR